MAKRTKRKPDLAARIVAELRVASFEHFEYSWRRHSFIKTRDAIRIVRKHCKGKP